MSHDEGFFKRTMDERKRERWATGGSGGGEVESRLRSEEKEE